MKPSILSFFPKDYPYPGQVEVLERSLEAYENGGYDTILVEAPVGFGKSPVAITLAKYFADGYILTPRKALQDQYFEDFTKDVTLLKGMSNYPCFPSGSERAEYFASRDRDYKGNMTYNKSMDIIRTGGTPMFSGLGCSNAPCGTDKDLLSACVADKMCPYDFAIERVKERPLIVCNLHSFIANASRTQRLQFRSLMLIDEAHDMRSILRDFITKTFTVPYPVISARMNIPETEDMQEWVAFFSQEVFKDKLTLPEDKEEYEVALGLLTEHSMRNFVVSYEEDPFCVRTTFKFIPRNLGNAAESFLLRFGKYRMMMSGTIYDKNYFCRSNGIDPEKTLFIRMPSTFAPNKKLVFMRDDHMTDNSFKNFEANYPKMLDNVRRVMKGYHDVRGLIHAPSYKVAERMAFDLGNRVLFHTADNFREVYDYFINESPPNAILISPICAQGVDLKYDRCRFQMIVRVPYPNASDAFMKDLLETDFSAYNYEALVVFGQMLGRVMRAPDDWGHTILLDSRFKNFVQKNRHVLPSDVLQSIKTR